MLHLPDHFRFDSGKDGGGVIIGSASEATFLALLCARERFIKINSSMNPFAVMSKLIGYTSKEVNLGFFIDILSVFVPLQLPLNCCLTGSLIRLPRGPAGPLYDSFGFVER